MNYQPKTLFTPVTSNPVSLMKLSPVPLVHTWLGSDWLFGQPLDSWVAHGILLAGIIVGALVLFRLLRWFIDKVAGRFAERTRTRWDDLLIENHVFARLSHLLVSVYLHYCCISLMFHWM